MPGTRWYRIDNCVPAGICISICRVLTGSSSNTFINLRRGRLVCQIISLNNMRKPSEYALVTKLPLV